MARLLTCGFEENNLTATMWDVNAGTAPTIGTVAPHSGTYRLNTVASVTQSRRSRHHKAAKPPN